jgi:hypothetical protein
MNEESEITSERKREKRMAKNLENLTQNELEIVQEFMDAFGLEQQEALETAIAEGAISEAGASMKFAPDNFHELKYYIVNNKSHYYKINKQCKKEKKDEMFEEDNFYYNTVITKTEDGYDLDKTTTIPLGTKPRIIVLANYLKAKRATFDASGKAEATNFETTLSKSLAKQDQDRMIILSGDDKGKSAKQIRETLERDYGKDKIPEKLKVKFRTITFGLVEVNGEWHRFYMESANRFNEEDKISYFFEKDIKSIVKSKYSCFLEKTKEDDNDNPIIQIIVEGELPQKEFDGIKEQVNSARADMLEFVATQYESAKSDTSKSSSKKASVSEDNDNGSQDDPFED